MHARYVDGITIRRLRNGDTDTVATLFARLGARSRERRFCGAKPRLDAAELAALSRVDAEHHVLVAYVGPDPRPAGIARLVREGRSAEIAFEVADEHQGRGIGSVLARAAREVLAEADRRPSDAVLRDVATTLRAASAADPDALVAGRLTEPVEASGFEAMAGAAPRRPAPPTAGRSSKKKPQPDRERVDAAR